MTEYVPYEISDTVKRMAGSTNVPDAVLTILNDKILISDHGSTLLLSRKAAIELLERLPKLIAQLQPTP